MAFSPSTSLPVTSLATKTADFFGGKLNTAFVAGQVVELFGQISAAGLRRKQAALNAFIEQKNAELESRNAETR